MLVEVNALKSVSWLAGVHWQSGKLVFCSHTVLLDYLKRKTCKGKLGLEPLFLITYLRILASPVGMVILPPPLFFFLISLPTPAQAHSNNDKAFKILDHHITPAKTSLIS